jgi:hypothetical protein
MKIGWMGIFGMSRQNRRGVGAVSAVQNCRLAFPEKEIGRFIEAADNGNKFF